MNAVTFESPGSKDLITKRMLPNLTASSINIDSLDIIQYFSYPNLINTYSNHIGTVYQLEPLLDKLVEWVPGWYTKQTHSMLKIIAIFEKNCSYDQEAKKKYVYNRILMQDWPLGRERKKIL